MGNYISIIIGCVGAVELITFLHQFSSRADQEHDRELEEELAAAGITGGTAAEPQQVSQVTSKETASQPPPPKISIKETSLEDPPEAVEEPVLVKTATQPVSKELTFRHSLMPRGPEIRFELYERSCSLSDVDRPLVDGLKLSRPLVRDDGSGRRKSIKKRNSSGSIDLKLSREEELRMFTSLEEEEFSSLSEGGYVPISYGSSATESSSGVVHPRRHRRFKRSPVKDVPQNKDENSSSSREVLDDIPLLEDPVDSVVSYPWGDIKPVKHRRHSRHEKSMSIEEMQEDEERMTSTTDEVTRGGAGGVAIEKVRKKRVHVLRS